MVCGKSAQVVQLLVVHGLVEGQKAPEQYRPRRASEICQMPCHPQLALELESVLATWRPHRRSLGRPVGAPSLSWWKPCRHRGDESVSDG